MTQSMSDYLAETLDAVRDDERGTVHQVPQALAEADPDLLAACLCTTEGSLFAAGNVDHELTVQSVAKAFVYALAIEEHGVEEVLARVDVEPSGEAFDVLSVEPETKRPRNPMINAGAMVVHGLIGGVAVDWQERERIILDGLSRLAGRELSIDTEAADDELAQAHRNLALAHLLRAEGVMEDSPEDVVTGYTRQCSVLVTPRDLAVMAATLATGGRQPITGEQVLCLATTRHVLSVMTTCGMYDSAGDWMSQVGIPAKSGVSGLIMGAIPGRFGLATLSPRLDGHGTSRRGEAIFTRASRELDLHLLTDPTGHDEQWRTLVGD
ncbi:glutaminase A [Marihabitans asiaticum]|uniref:glutaminase A n=1 Tax=Marihabitans asiaticum TaxID=415218 RepID=UPI0014795F19|nr:glutaminase A [Marihabitans asiaticum]